MNVQNRPHGSYQGSFLLCVAYLAQSGSVSGDQWETVKDFKLGIRTMAEYFGDTLGYNGETKGRCGNVS